MPAPRKKKPASRPVAPSSESTLSENDDFYSDGPDNFWDEDTPTLNSLISGKSFFPVPARLPPVPSGSLLEPLFKALKAKGHGHVLLLPDEYDERALTILFGDGLTDLERTFGRLFLLAVLGGDQDFPSRVREAIRDADTLFSRDKEKNLLPAFFRYYAALPEPKPTLGKIKEGFEEHYGRQYKPGWALSGRQWRVLRDAVRLKDSPRAKSGPRG